MKRLLVIILLCCCSCAGAIHAHAQLKNILQHAKDKATDKANNAVDKTVDNSGNNSNSNNSNNSNQSNNSTADNNDQQQTNSTQTQAAPPSIKAYQNYDFVPGDTVLFADDFADDQDGEFPSHWELEKGQGQLNKINGELAMFLTEGNYVRVKPRMKTDKYLNDPFTIEFDYYNKDNAYGLITFLGRINPDCQCESTADVKVSASEVTFGGDVSFSKSYTPGLDGDNFINKWHHVAIAVKNRQLKVYVDQNRVLVVPDTKNDFFNVGFGGIGDENQPLIFKNVRVAAGGNMNMIGKKFTESKIVTHGITFDVDQSTIKPESMGTLNMIVGVLKANPDVKFEIDGHTDNSGAAAHNMTLSQQRADAVKTQLVNMGIDASRLTTKGFGDTKPIDTNDTPSGKANNRRVEFVKM